MRTLCMQNVGTGSPVIFAANIGVRDLEPIVHSDMDVPMKMPFHVLTHSDVSKRHPEAYLLLHVRA